MICTECKTEFDPVDPEPTTCACGKGPLCWPCLNMHMVMECDDPTPKMETKDE